MHSSVEYLIVTYKFTTENDIIPKKLIKFHENPKKRDRTHQGTLTSMRLFTSYIIYSKPHVYHTLQA